jgi:L-ascorbate metabolism protein UlaG (beta-lactamase superfamily)
METWTFKDVWALTSRYSMRAVRLLAMGGACMSGACLGAAGFGAADPARAASNGCHAVASGPRVVQPVAVKPAFLAKTEARVTFIGHATFLIESADGVRMVTDYNDFVRPTLIPDIVTMNRAHSTHYTNAPPAGIKHVLRGWTTDGGPAQHEVTLKDVTVRNVPTNIRDWGGGAGAYGNSIFIFELAGLCIGHLGHLHHTLTPEQIGAIGQLDVVLVPVDGGYTMDVAGMIDVLRALKARLIVPMHYFNQFTLERFVERVRGEFPIEMASSSALVISQALMPSEPTVLVLPGN